MVRIYIASKMHHAERWRGLYDELPDVHICSHWPFLEPFVHPSGENARKFWHDDVQDISDCHALIVYAEEGEKLRGALVEAGIAIGMGRPVIVVGEHPDFGTWSFHPKVSRATTLAEAVQQARQLVNG